MTAIVFDGYDGDELVCPLINVWKDYGDRTKGIADAVWHGEKGQLLERRGNACKVRTVAGTEGFVTYWFIKELKGEYQEERLQQCD